MNFFEQYDQLLSSDEQRFVATAQSFCSGPFSKLVHSAYCRGEPYPKSLVEEWAGLKMLSLQARPEDGGYNASFACKVRVAQEIALHSFAAAFSLNNLQGSVTKLSRIGTETQRERLLDGMLNGSILCAPAFSEPAGGSDLGALATLATPTNGGWLINGSKAWISNGMMVNHLVLLARVADVEGPDNVASFIIDCDNEKTVRRREIMVSGARSFRLAEFQFQDHFVPTWALLQKPGEAFKASMQSINAARVHVAAMCVASLYATLQETTAYCASRHAFGKPLLKHQGLGWELAEVSTRLEAANALVARAVYHVNAGQAILTLAAQAKKFAVDTAIWGIDQCMRIMGAVGASNQYRLSMMQSEVKMADYGDGTSQILLERIRSGLVKTYGTEPKGSD